MRTKKCYPTCETFTIFWHFKQQISWGLSNRMLLPEKQSHSSALWKAGKTASSCSRVFVLYQEFGEGRESIDEDTGKNVKPTFRVLENIRQSSELSKEDWFRTLQMLLTYAEFCMEQLMRHPLKILDALCAVIITNLNMVELFKKVIWRMSRVFLKSLMMMDKICVGPLLDSLNQVQQPAVGLDWL